MKSVKQPYAASPVAFCKVSPWGVWGGGRKPRDYHDLDLPGLSGVQIDKFCAVFSPPPRQVFCSVLFVSWIPLSNPYTHVGDFFLQLDAASDV